MSLLEKLIGGTFVVVVIYLFIVNASESSKVIGAFAQAYTSGVSALQGNRVNSFGV